MNRNKMHLSQAAKLFKKTGPLHFQDGTTEAVLTVHLLKDGLLWRTETGSTPIEKKMKNKNCPVLNI